VSITSGTLRALVQDVTDSLAAGGIDRLLIVSGHGGNYVLSNVAQEASVRGARIAVFPTSVDWRAARQAADMVTDSHADMHAGELETSILLHVHPRLVRPGYVEADEAAPDRAHMLTLGLRAYTTSGVVGSPSFATAEKGKAVLEHLLTAAEPHLAALGWVKPASTS
jgi:creatinine amidohydrolase